jgi:hypothetical protein
MISGRLVGRYDGDNVFREMSEILKEVHHLEDCLPPIVAHELENTGKVFSAHGASSLPRSHLPECVCALVA